MPNVQMPDGTIVEMPDQITPEQGTRLRSYLDNYKAGIRPATTKDVVGAKPPSPVLNMAPEGAPQPNLQPTEGGASGGLSDALTGPKAAVGAGENLLSGITGGAGSLADAVTGAVPGTHDWGYKPRTQMGQDMAAAAGKGASALGNAAFEHVIAPATRAAGGDVEAMRQTLAERVPQALGAVGTIIPALKLGAAGAGTLARTAVGDAAGEAPAATVPNPITGVQQAGFKIRPSDVAARNPTATRVPGSLRESLTSSPEQTATFQRHNSALATQLGGADIGVPSATKITPDHIEAASKAPGAVYDKTGQAIGTVDKPQPGTLDTLRAVAADQTPQGAVSAGVRVQLSRMIDGLNSGKYPGSQLIKDISYLRDKGGQGGFHAAEALESEMENQLEGQPETLAAFKAARTQFAKIHDVQDALRGGQIDPQRLLTRSALRKETGRPLTGNLAAIAQAADEAPGVVRLPSATADQSPVAGSFSKTLANVAGRGLSKLPGMDIGSPALQERIAAAAPSPGPLPNPAGLSRTAAPAPAVMGTTPGAVGVQPRQLGLALAPGRPAPPAFGLEPPPGSVIEPAQRTIPVPPGRPLNPLGAAAGTLDDAAAGGSVNSDRRLNLTKQMIEQIRRGKR